jgi:glycosyltransferase 2 family protein
MHWLKRHALKLMISSALAAVFIWLLNRGGMPWVPPERALEGAAWWCVPAYLGMWSVVHLIRAVRWHFLLSPIATIPLRQLIAVSFLGFAAIVLLPMRAGEIVRPAMVRKKGQLSGWSVMGTVGAERIIDGLLLSAMLLVGLTLGEPLNPLPDKIGHLNISPRVVPTAGYSALALFGAAFVTMAVFYFARSSARAVVVVLVSVVSRRFATWLADRIEKVTLGLNFLPRPGLTLAFVGITAVYWFLNAAATQLLAVGVGLPGLNFAQACVVTGVLALGIMVPNAPGFFGAFQFSIYAALSMFLPEAQLLGSGGVLVFFLYIGQMGVTFGGAALGAFLLRTTFTAALATEEEDLA